MKLARIGDRNNERPALLDSAGRIRDLSDVISDVTPDVLSPEGLAKLASIAPEGLPIISQPKRFGVPFTGARKFIGVGMNYADHAAEVAAPRTTEPLLFMKAITSLNGPDDAVIMPKGGEKLDWEVELGIIIGSTARAVSETDAMRHVAGYCVVNDLSERAFQMDRGGTWDKGKGCDTFGPVGPWLVTADEIGSDPQLDLWLDVNGERRQSGNTRAMIFGVTELVSYISHFFTLEPGDIITTGTPSGIGMSRTPPVYLRPGDVMTLGVEGLGQQTQRVVSWDDSDRLC